MTQEWTEEKLKEKIEVILRAHIVAYEKAWSDKSTFGSKQGNETTDQIHELYKSATYLKGNKKLRGRLSSYLADMGHTLTSDELDVLMGFIESTEEWKK